MNNITKYSVRLDENRVTSLVKDASKSYSGSCIIDDPEKAVELIEYIFDASNQAEEYVWMLALSTDKCIKGVFEVSHGTLNSSLIHPREIFTRAMLCGADTILLAHNHPSGSLVISNNDKDVTARIKDAGKLMGIPLIDHIIIADGRNVSITLS